MAVMYVNDGAGKVPKSFMKQVIDGYNKTIYYNENPKEIGKETYTPPKSGSNSPKGGGIGLVLALAGALIVVSIVKR